jgi:putative oxidoreductase
MIKTIQAVMLTLIFFIAGINKVLNFKGVVNDFNSRLSFLPKFLAQIIILAVIVIEIVCPAIVVYSFNSNKVKLLARVAVVILIGFTILATLLYHLPTNVSQIIKFLSNTALLGGLWLLIEQI